MNRAEILQGVMQCADFALTLNKALAAPEGPNKVCLESRCLSEFRAFATQTTGCVRSFTPALLVAVAQHPTLYQIFAFRGIGCLQSFLMESCFLDVLRNKDFILAMLKNSPDSLFLEERCSPDAVHANSFLDLSLASEFLRGKGKLFKDLRILVEADTAIPQQTKQRYNAWLEDRLAVLERVNASSSASQGDQDGAQAV